MKHMLRPLQWIVTLGSLFLVLRSLDIANMSEYILSIQIEYFLLALFIALTHFWVGAWRWQKLITLVSGKNIQLKPLFNLYLISFFMSSVLPGTITGDALRIYGTRKEVNGSANAALIVLLERFLGLSMLLVMGCVSWFMIPTRLDVKFSLSDRIIGVMIVMSVLIALVVFYLIKYHKSLFAKLVDWFNNILQSLLRFPDAAINNPKTALKILCGTFVYQSLSVMIIFGAFRAMAVDVPPLLFLAVVSVVTLLLTLPLSIQGIGIREYLYVTLLLPYGLKSGPVISSLALTYIIGLPFIFWGWLLFNRQSKEIISSYEKI